MNVSAFSYKLTKSEGKKFIVLRDNIEIDKLVLAVEFFKKLFGKRGFICPFYSYEIPPHSSIKPASYIISGRLASIYRLLNEDENVVFVTNLSALLQPVMKEEAFVDRLINIKVGDDWNFDNLIKRLVEAYYERVDHVEDVGEFAKRGYVFDVFVPFYEKPLRIEFFDTEVDSIRLFYLENYRTFQEIKEATILPAKEYSYDNDELGYVLLKDKTYIDRYNLDGFKKYTVVDEQDLQAAYRLISFYKEDRLFNSKENIESLLSQCESMGELFKIGKLFPDTYSIGEKIKKIADMSKFFRIVIACGSSIRVEHVSKFLKEKNIDHKKPNGNPLTLTPGVYLSDGYLFDGIMDERNRFAVVTFSDLFGKRELFIPRTKRKLNRSVSFRDGDRVVHKRYGIALFNGLKRLKIDDSEEDYFELEYEGGDKIYLPVYNAEQLSEYNGSEPLSSLRNNKWAKAQELAKKSIKKILTELVGTYAKRHLVKRKPYDVNLYEIKEFEAMFEYDETYDQLKAIEDIKQDMSKDAPMDRLVCGDVSFGKTEVAMRAIAISVFNFRQAVFMVPTTLLSLQHFKTLKERFANFPVKIALLNRFTTKKEKEIILDGLKNGEIDVLVSTHSVYSDKIEFKNLGLVVIDEEHRFGVKVKEHLKSRYPSVDMLYMSATPIPRTLNMSLNGIMDISVIKTPPLERKPIETIISKRKSHVIRDAILRELSRNGRVYFVHNSIDNIEDVKRELDNLLPFARKSVVHAKMPKSKIKSVFESFNKSEIDILVSTSIIESGLDIKSVDTIIIDNADRFGLSDLYQLRGRVGRGDRVSYAYLLYEKKLTENAVKRLRYMSEFIERGSGFNLALKDMELRGYGNLLGKDQSGKIKSLGYNVYISLIEEAICEMKNQPVERDVEIKHAFDAYVPDDFAKSEGKVEIYKRLSQVKTREELEQLKREFQGRFGDIPSTVENLFMIVDLKILSKSVYIKKLNLSSRGIMIEFYVDATIDTDKLVKVVNEKKGRFLSETTVFFGLLGKSLKQIHASLLEIFSRISK